MDEPSGGPVEHLQFNLAVPVDVFFEDGTYVAVCKPLDVASQGDTKEEARQNVREALMMFITSCYVRGTLEEILHEAGFMPASSSVEYPVADEKRDIVRVPVSLVANAQTHAS